jgi:hypothetical protein
LVDHLVSPALLAIVVQCGNAQVHCPIASFHVKLIVRAMARFSQEQEMRVSRSFLVIGSVYILIGVVLGMYMGASGDHSLYPVHAHINLLGFVLMMIFGLVYRQFPTMADSTLARVHFWLHQAGVLVLMVMLMLLFTGRIAEAAMAPLGPIAELAILIGLMCFGWNIYRHAD